MHGAIATSIVAAILRRPKKMGGMLRMLPCGSSLFLPANASQLHNGPEKKGDVLIARRPLR
jgi:hypothetical protein